MSNIFDTLFANENKATLQELQKTFDLSENQTKVAIEELIPALSRGLQKNTQATAGMDELLDALRTGRHERYMEKPSTLASPETVKDGNDILGHIFGSREVSREVASRASTQSGLSSALLKKMLPVLATVLMGTLSKQVLGNNSPTAARSDQGGLLSSLLDGDRDGSIWDDVLGMAAKSMLR